MSSDSPVWVPAVISPTLTKNIFYQGLIPRKQTGEMENTVDHDCLMWISLRSGRTCRDPLICASDSTRPPDPARLVHSPCWYACLTVWKHIRQLVIAITSKSWLPSPLMVVHFELEESAQWRCCEKCILNATSSSRCHRVVWFQSTNSQRDKLTSLLLRYCADWKPDYRLGPKG